jgi:hypothetical protein
LGPACFFNPNKIIFFKQRNAYKHYIQNDIIFIFYCFLQVTHPFELLGMDLIGKLRTTKSGYQYICVMVDYHTKWPQAYPLHSKTAEEVTECIVKFFHQFEAPKRILTDQGREFVNAVSLKIGWRNIQLCFDQRVLFSCL